ncbi:MAG: efflux RND transporter periplasmic adaptor subunit [Prolixibacteraceae bacterium]|nr:efflux RND transporter periplasmic adaptor subunit [Prolixibacteraceae bacterium]
MKKNILIIIGIAILFGCGEKKKPEIAEEEVVISKQIQLTPEQMKTVDIQIGTLEEKEVHEHITCNGSIILSPDNKATVSFSGEGIVKQIYVQIGDWVEKGDRLASMQHPSLVDLQTEYLQLTSECSYLQKEYDRQTELFNQKAISEKEYQKTTSNYQITKSRRTGITEKLNLIGINPENLSEDKIQKMVDVIAPISGYVNSLNVELGELVTPDNPMFRIVNNSEVNISLELFAQYKSAVKKGQTLEFCLGGHPQKMFLATITSVGKSVDQNKKTVNVTAHPASHDVTFAEGAYIEAMINIVEKQKAVLPQKAVVTKANESNIFVATDVNTFKKVPVKIVGTYDDYVAINFEEEPITENIVIRGANYLSE